VQDIHAFAVKRECNKLGFEATILDTAQYCEDFSLSSSVSRDYASTIIVNSDGGELELSALSGVWWRRPGRSVIENDWPETIKQAVINERANAVFGSLLTGTNSFNDIGASRRASYKPNHLYRAKQFGFPVPKTLFTNSPKKAVEFVQSLADSVVYKTFVGQLTGLYETRRWTREDLARLDTLSSCPAIFQEFIPGRYDVRVTVVGDEIFASRMELDHHSEIIDGRLTTTAITAYSLPSDFATHLKSFVRELGLVYAAIDLRRSTNGDLFFLEVNPEGQYLWTEIEAGLRISAAIAGRLCRLGD
jgi:glutathione synthase/RimK-type ligase-like ATP-grasp enzyme